MVADRHIMRKPQGFPRMVVYNTPNLESLLVLLLKHAEAEGMVVRVRVEIWMRTG